MKVKILGKTRFLSFVLSLTLLMGLMPTTVLAADSFTIGDIQITQANAAVIQGQFDAQGSSIASVTNNNGTITIKLLKDIIGRIEIHASGNYIFDADGHTFSGGPQNEAIGMGWNKNVTLELVGNGTYTSGVNNTLVVNNNTLIIKSATVNGKLINSGTLKFALEDGYEYFTVKNNGVNLFDEKNTVTKTQATGITGTSIGLVVAQHTKPGDVGSGGTGVRSLTDAYGNVFLGNQYIEIGIAPVGSFGTTVAAPTSGAKYFHPDNSQSYKLGLRSDGDGWDTGAAPTTRDFFLPGTVDEGFMIGWSTTLGGTTTLRSKASQIGSGGIASFTGYSVTDKSTAAKLMAESVGVASNTLQYTQNVSFGADDKLFTTTITLQNTSAAPIYNANYIRKFDPDQSLTQGHTTDNYFFKDVTGGIWAVASSDPLGVPSPVKPENHKAALDNVQNPFVFYTDDPRAQVISCKVGTNTFEDILNRGTDLYGTHFNSDTGIGLEFKFPVINPGQSVTFTYQSSLDPNFKDVQQAIEDLAVMITKQPVSRTYAEGKIDGKLVVQGEMLIDGVSAGSDALVYQWYSNTINSTEGGTPVPDATQRSFEIPKRLSANTTTFYYCIVSATVSGISKSAASGVAMIRIVPSGSTIYSVKFNENSTNIVSNMPAMQTLSSGEKIAQPADPSISGMEFTGWYTASTGGTTWDFITPITADTTLYAQWRLPDTTKPVISAISGNPTAWANTDTSITFTVTDDRALATVTVSKDGGTAQLLTGALSQYSFSTDGNGVYVITATDTKGNTSTQTVNVTKIDTILPVISNVEGNPSNWTNKDVTLTVIANDVLSGLAPYAYSFDNGATWQSSNSKVFTSNQNVQVKVKDAAGNISAASTVNVTKMDKIIPVISNVDGNPSNRTNKDVTLTVIANDVLSGLAPYAYSFDNGTTWQSSNSKVFTSNQDVQVKVKDAAGNISAASTVKITKIDKVAPTGTITIKDNSFKNFINTITFGLFFKNTAEVTIGAEDNSGETVTVGYTLSETELTDFEGVSWTAYTGKITLTSNLKVIVYAKLTDTAGNVSIINSDGLVLFTDSTADTASVSFTKTGTADVTAAVNLNGNTIKSVSIGEDKLTENTNYTVSGGTITLTAAYLNTLAAGNYTVSVSFYPLGETETPKAGSDTPDLVSIDLTVSKAITNLSVTANPTGSQTRPNSVTLSANLPAGATGSLLFMANGNIFGAPAAAGQTVTFTASGSVNNYTFTVVYSGDNNYESAVSPELSYSFIKGEQSTLSFAAGTPTVKTYGDNTFTVNATGGSSTGAISYSVVSGPATVSGNTVTLTGAGSVVLRATKAADDDYNAKSADTTITVGKKSIIITGITAESKVYDGNKTATVSGTAEIAGKVGGDMVSVSGGSATFADKIVGNGKPVTFTGFTLSGADAGNYTFSDQPASVTANITAKPITMNVTIQDKAYDGLNTAIISGASLNSIVSGDTVNLASLYPAATFSSVGAANNIAVSFDGNFTLTGTDAGNYTLTQPSGITGNITNNYSAVKGTDYTASTTQWSKTDFVVTAKPGFELSLTDTAGGAWSDSLTKSDETANGSINFYVRKKTTGAISLAAFENYKIDKTAPTGTIFIGGKSWNTFLNTITFGLFFNATQTVSIDADNDLSGIAKVEYATSSSQLSLDEVKALTWQAGRNVNVTVEDTKQFIYYAKITDYAGNISYLSTDGAEYDTTAPDITGITSGGTYYTTQIAAATDKNLKSVTLNSEAKTSPVRLDGNTDATYTVVVTDMAGNSTTRAVTMKTIASLSNPIDSITENNVKSSDKIVIETVKSNVGAVGTANATDAEKAALKAITDRCNSLLEKIADTAAEIRRMTDAVNGYDLLTVKSSDKAALEQLIQDMDTLAATENLTSDEAAALGPVKTTANGLLSKISDTAAEIKRITDTVNDYDLATVKSSDKAALEQFIRDIDTIVSSDNMTEDEITVLNGIKTKAENLLAKISDTAALIKKLTDTIDGYKLGEVKSTDKVSIEQVITDAETLIATENLTGDEKAALETVKTKANALLARIADASESSTKKEIKDSENINKDNVKLSDKDTLIKARAALETAIRDYEGNYTETELTALKDQLATVIAALPAIDISEKVVNSIIALPEPSKVKASDKDAINAAKAAYDALTDFEKTMVGSEYVMKLDADLKALADLDMGKVPPTGDNSNMLLWIALLFISGGVLTAVGVQTRKRKSVR